MPNREIYIKQILHVYCQGQYRQVGLIVHDMLYFSDITILRKFKLDKNLNNSKSITASKVL